MVASSTSLWDADLFARVETLEWRSHVLAEGFLQGLHRSRLQGFSSEFSQYHPYLHGDDLRYVDWRAFGRLDRLYIREFDAETNLRCQILVDASGSMAYRSDGSPFRKYDYAALLAAALMRLLQSQRDACGLSLAKTQLAEHLSPRLGRPFFSRCLRLLETTQPEGLCDLATCVDQLAELFRKRGLIAIFTDTWDDLSKTLTALERLRYDHHEVCLFQIVDPREMDFAFKESMLLEDMETGVRLPVTPDWIRTRYFTAMQRHQTALVKRCRDLRITHHLLTTTESPFKALAAFLAQRENRP